MIIFCERCLCEYDTSFRLRLCPHPTFMANDGERGYRHNLDSKVRLITSEEMIDKLLEAGWHKHYRNVWTHPVKYRVYFGVREAFKTLKQEHNRSSNGAN